MRNKRYIRIFAVLIACVAMCIMCVFAACKSEATPVGISIRNGSEVEVNVGHTLTLKADVEMSDGSRYADNNVEWSVDKEGVISLNVGGVAVAENVGDVVVTASVAGYSASCTVHVVKGVFRVGVKDDVKNFGYRESILDDYCGMEIDLAAMIADELGYDSISYTTVDPDEREEKLEDGDLDCVIATYSVTEERKAVVNFSDPYYTDYVQVLAGENYVSEGITDVAGVSEYVDPTKNDPAAITPCVVGTVDGTTAFEAFDSYCAEEKIPWQSRLGEQIFVNKTYPDYSACEKALASGEVDLFVADHSILSSHTPDDANLLDDRLASQNYAVATAKTYETMSDGSRGAETENPLTVEVNALIDGWLKDGTIEGLTRYYDIYVEPVTSETEPE